MTQNNQALVDEKQIPKGYKKTIVGVFPIDWEISQLKDIANFGGGTTPSRALYNRYYAIEGHAWVKTLDLNNDKIYRTQEYITDTALSEVAIKLHSPNIVLVAMYGGFNQIGRTGLLKVNAAINQALVAIKPNSSILDSEFLQYNLNYRVDFWKSVASSSRKDPNITSNDVKAYVLAFPNVKEQQKIANSLSDTDTLISELEKLIEKKQAIKTATMQQLLTGKTRLPEFALREDGTPKAYKDSELGQIPEDWNVTSIGNTLTIKHGKSQKLVETNNGKFPILATGGQIGWAKEYLYNKPSVLIGRKGTINKPRFIDQPFWTVDTLFYSEIDDKYCAKFLFYKFCSIDWNNYNEASGVPSLNAKTIENVHISVCLLDEQKEIVKILNVIDDEITRLKDKRRKLFNIKKSMMQELLTGKTRLV